MQERRVQIGPGLAMGPRKAKVWVPLPPKVKVAARTLAPLTSQGECLDARTSACELGRGLLCVGASLLFAAVTATQADGGYLGTYPFYSQRMSSLVNVGWLSPGAMTR